MQTGSGEKISIETVDTSTQRFIDTTSDNDHEKEKRMDITINIPQLDALTAAINNLAASYGAAPAPASSAEGNEAKPKATRKKADVTTADEKPALTPAAGPQNSGSAEPTPASDGAASSETPAAVVDAGTGETVVIDHVAELDDARKAEIKAKAAKLTQVPNGVALLTKIFEDHGGTTFKTVPVARLLEVETAIDGALALAD